MKVALFEATDFAEGTSSRSSKLIHGGIRYLENFDFRLVFEALSERSKLFRIAPHLVHPLRFVVPIFENSRVGYWKMLAGMWLYDLLALMDTPKMHEDLSRENTLERIPSLQKDGLVGAMEYSDAYTDDDRLVTETLRDAHRYGAHIFNYCRVENVDQSNQRVQSVTVKDQLTGESFIVRAHNYLSGVGPWTDQFGQSVTEDWKKCLRPTKGVHLVFEKSRIPIEKAVVMAVQTRIIFVIPRHEMVIVGTTDTDYQDDPANVRCTPEDTAYLLDALNQYFPDLQISEDDIISNYAGVRPLVEDGSSSEGKTSREHQIWNPLENMTCVAGGKYTTYRLISKQAIDKVLKSFPFERKMDLSRSDTDKPLNPLISKDVLSRDRDYFEAHKRDYTLSPEYQEKLFFRHAGESEGILKVIQEKYAHYPCEEAYWLGEAHFAIEETRCLTIKDFLPHSPRSRKKVC